MARRSSTTTMTTTGSRTSPGRQSSGSCRAGLRRQVPMTTYIVVSATCGEARYVPDGWEVLVTGVGKVAAATLTAQELATRDARDLMVVNLGSAGALRDGLTGVFTPGTVLNHDMNADLVRSLGLDPVETIDVPGGDGTVLA